MEYAILGKTSIEVSRLCYGTLTMGPLQRNLSPDEGAELLIHAFEAGVNFLDTAQLYKTYPHIRRALKRFPGNIVISSKTYAYEKKDAYDAVEEARRELDRDYIDIFMIHETESIHTLRGHMAALDELYRLKSLGIIRAVGCSTHHTAGVYGAAELGLDVLHPILNYEGLGIADGGRAEMETACSHAAGLGIGIFTMKALGGGNLYRSPARGFSYVLSLPFVTSVAVGMQTLVEIDANLSFFDCRDPAVFDNVRRDKPPKLLIETYCDGCGACADACPVGALEVKNGLAVCDPVKCVLCGYCSAHCPNFFIKII